MQRADLSAASARPARWRAARGWIAVGLTAAEVERLGPAPVPKFAAPIGSLVVSRRRGAGSSRMIYGGWVGGEAGTVP